MKKLLVSIITKLKKIFSKKLKISMIVTHDNNYCMGINGTKYWHLADDIERFNSLTKNKILLLSRNECNKYDNCEQYKIVITGNRCCSKENTSFAKNIIDALNLAKNYSDEVFVLGGKQMFLELFDRTEMLYITKVDCSFDGIEYFPKFDLSDFTLVNKEIHKSNEHNTHDFTFYTYKRNK